MNKARHLAAWLAWAVFYGCYSYFVTVRTAFHLPDFVGFLCIHIVSFYFSVRVAFLWANPQWARLNWRTGLRVAVVVAVQLIAIPVVVSLISIVAGTLDIGFDRSATPQASVLNFLDVVVFLYSGLIFALVYLRFAKMQAQHGEQLEAVERLCVRLSESEQANLEQSLIPHLYGNLVGTVTDAVRQKPDEAAYFVNIFNQIVRFYARIDLGELVAMGDELDIMALVIELVEARLGKEPALEMEVEEAVRQLQVPPMLLMLIVENVDKYGVWDDPDQPVQLFIGTRLGQLIVMVRNVVRSAHATPPLSTKKGLRSIRERLDARQVAYVMHSETRNGRFSFVLLVDFD
ncbi:MAG TPA: hypothetical protein VNQ55_02325 [Parapedobacter sp.]|nr:hypothetical protein [Parapedobacter sp.]